MAWTYTGDPANSTSDAVRLLIGDTDTNDQQLTDAEIAYFLSDGTVKSAAIAACLSLAAKYARKVSKAIGRLRLELQQRSDAYFKLAKEIEIKNAKIATAYFGGLSEAERETDSEDEDLVQPAFKRRMMDYNENVEDEEDVS